MDADRESPFQPTIGKIFAGLWVVLWVGVAWHEFGGIFAARIGMISSFILSLIWFPDLLSKLPLPIHQRDAGALGPVPANFLKFVGWMILLGLPATWFFLWRDSG